MALKTNTDASAAVAEAPVTDPTPEPVVETTTPDTEGSVVTETKPVTSIGSKKKKATTGNLIIDVATEVENLTKTKALNLAASLVEDIDTNSFRLGGVLKVISDNSWFEGAANFGIFVRENYGFQERKARYLISIYDNLVMKQIPWEVVSHLGWTKLKDLAPILTVDNVAEWVAKAEALTVVELQAALKSGEPSGDGEKTAKTSDGIVKISFKLHTDQAETVQQALAKAKGELQTEHDTVALENICAGYLGGNSTVTKLPSFEEMVNAIGFEPALTRISEMFKEYDIVVTPVAAAVAE